ncbi:splicing factor YJU2 [Skeletonema marinoi]|uniref:Splicing factor YJU2 n=1 Tax=Skeletonema marinoi TaxID=267567 RepID=A0AAD8XXC7_9STRA|nr:splicing factor YJU2 [Skeletonema marinoi]
MGERKVLNKYIPADFDPLLVPRSKKPKDDLVTVRMMLPFSIQCSTCSSFLYRGRKFNSKKEAVKGIEGKYLGIQRFRFYIKCSDCARPITFLTDPQKADYEMESGGTRNYEVWHDETKVNAENERSVEEEEKLDSMKALENRVAESQREMAEMDALEEIRAMNERHSRLMKGGGRKVDVAEAVLKAREVAMGGGGGKMNGGVAEEFLDLNENGLTKDEEDLVQSIKFGAVVGAGSTDAAAAVEIHRLDEHDELLAEKRRQEEAAAIMNKQKQRDEEDKKASKNANNVPVFKVKRKKKKINSSDTVTNSTILPEAKRTKVEEEKKAESNPPPEPAGLSGLLGGYGSDSDSD